MLYRRLAALNRHAVDELNARGLLAPDLATRLQRFAQLAERLADIGDAELAGRQLSADDADLIKHIGDTADSLTTFTPATGALTALETDDKLALVADVATDPNSQRALTVGLGAAFVIWALVPIGNDTVLTRGAVYSFYEFPWPIADRLTDEAWQQLSPRPALPAWTASFTANGPFEPAG